MKIVEKLSTYAALIGVIGAIGGGFYTWGQFNLRLDQIESKEFVVNETVDLSPMEEKIANLKVELIDRIDEDRRAHVWTPVTQWSRMPSSAWKKKNKNKKHIKKKKQKKNSYSFIYTTQVHNTH